MTRFLKYKKLIILSIVSILSATFLLSTSGRSSSDTVHLEVSKILKRCRESKRNLNILNSDCLFSDLGKFVSQKNLPQIIVALEDIFSSENSSATKISTFGTTLCHLPAHIVGQIAYRKGVTLAEILKVCSTACDSGCLHGAFQIIFKEQGGGFIENVKNICSNRIFVTNDDVNACWHIVGHGVAEYFGNNIEATSKICATLPTKSEHDQCMGGVRMEYLMPSPSNLTRVNFLNLDDYISFCKIFSGTDQDDCLTESGHVALRIFGNKKDALEICHKVSKNSNIRNKCAFSTGNTFSSTHQNPPEALYKFCQAFIDKDMQKECIKGEIEILALEFREDSVQLCSLVDVSFKKECLSFLEETVASENSTSEDKSKN